MDLTISKMMKNSTNHVLFFNSLLCLNALTLQNIVFLSKN